MSADEAAALATLKAFVASAEQWAAERTAWATVYDKSQALEADNARLRALVKEAEWANFRDDESQRPYCPWCDTRQSSTGVHAAHCPAFTPEGVVR